MRTSPVDASVTPVRKRVRIVAAGAAVALTAAFGVPSGAGAEPDPTAPFVAAPEGSVVNPLPAGVSGEAVTLMLEVSGDPVTVASAEAAQPLTEAQEDQHADALARKQAPIEHRVRELGGTVLGTYQEAYNGIKVRVTADQAPALAAITDVVGVHVVRPVDLDNTNGVPLIGSPAVWDGVDGLHGEGMRIAILDTGIDYTHADFGGPGTPEAYELAHAAETAPADPALFGPAAAKVKGGIDLVGDSYNAGSQPVPHPDPNPLDCQGHGTHVAGTAAGYGVLRDGETYGGPYDADTIASNSWLVGPGVAPEAELYAVRVFGCNGGSLVVVDAIEWAVENDMDVINMSLGSPFGTADDPSAVAADNAAKNGVIVVASAGNRGPNPYITGSPGTGTRTISVAASDPTAAFPGAVLGLSTGATLTAINANGAALPAGPLPVKVLWNASGCDPAEFEGTAGMLVVTAAGGTCARVARAIFGQQHGAAAVLMVNFGPTFPPFEGPITRNPDTGQEYDVTIPFLGVPSNVANTLLAADGGTTTLTATTIENPGYLAPASFTSGGPRTGDSWLKPDVTAPGVSIASAAVGTGNAFAIFSGTSMAAPHTAGLAALVKQAHPDWKKVEYWKAAIVNTADSAQVAGYSTRLGGSGLVQAPPAVVTDVVAVGDKGTATLNFGFAELAGDYSQKAQVELSNLGDTPATFVVGTERAAGSPHGVSVKQPTVTVPAHRSKNVEVTLQVPAATAGDSSAFNDVAGLVTFTPASPTDNGGVALRVPYYLVPQTTSEIDTRIDTNSLRKTGSGEVRIRNRGAGAGRADFYVWGLSDGRDLDAGEADVRAVGVQSFPANDILAFAVATGERWTYASRVRFNIFVDVNLDGTDDYSVVGGDFGAIFGGGAADGRMVSVVYDLRTGKFSSGFFANAPLNSATLVLPLRFSQLCAAGSPCLSAENPRFTYTAESFGDAHDAVEGVGSFNPFTPAIRNGMLPVSVRPCAPIACLDSGIVMAPGAEVLDTISVDAAEWEQTPALGVMVVSHDDKASDEAQLIPVTLT